ncbi:MAG: hypothetical protein IKR46_02695, partial [Clostridia bacterium]|nr:hypothetical protein [Clostridia bacterium]
MKFVKHILCLAILLSIIPTAYAETDKGAADALKMVKERIDTSEYTEFRSTYYKEEGEGTRYSFTWTKGDDDYSELYVSVCGKIITYYSESNYGDEEGGKFGLDKDEALLIAREFIKKTNPDICEHIALFPEKEQWVHSDFYSIDLYRVENGIPVLNQTGGISISKATKRVSYFYIDYEEDIDFKPLDGIIGESDAKAAYIDKAALDLRYKYKTDYNKKEITPYLEYASKEGITAINAIDGSLYEVSDGGHFLFGNEEKSRAADEAAGEFSPAELEEIEKIAGLLTEAQAEQKIRSNEIIKLPKDYNMQNVSFGRNTFNKNEYFYNFDFGKDGGYAGVNIDAKTGEIFGFYKYEDG